MIDQVTYRSHAKDFVRKKAKGSIPKGLTVVLTHYRHIQRPQETFAGPLPLNSLGENRLLYMYPLIGSVWKKVPLQNITCHRLQTVNGNPKSQKMTLQKIACFKLEGKYKD